ncbi:transglycosylase SLT domain-containing protein [Pseudooceanicola sp.]|uniref:transglycosylase SLT domain-containing protein n=1 Tax=Pseudooceanicola sp. TaxID=1914328 RepID=UPI0035C75DAC
MRAFLLILALVLPGQAVAQWAGFYTPTARPAPAPVTAGPGDSGLCIREILLAQMRYQIPDNLLLGIGLQESGLYREGALTVWPFTANAEGKGAYFETEAEAVAWVNARRAEGITSIDLGCMQVNMHWHPDAFDSVADGFNPARNVDYAAQYLLRLYKSRGDWQAAAASYHSRSEDLGQAYLSRLEQNLKVANARIDSLRALAGAVTRRGPEAPTRRAMPTTGVFWSADLGGGTGAGGRSLFGPEELAPILPVFMRGS